MKVYMLCAANAAGHFGADPDCWRVYASGAEQDIQALAAAKRNDPEWPEIIVVSAADMRRLAAPVYNRYGKLVRK